MDISRSEAIPSLWDEERDPAFFRIVSRTFSAEFLYGAGVLLACNDPHLDTGVSESGHVLLSAR